MALRKPAEAYKLNASIIQHAIAIHENCERLESRLHVLCCKVGSLYKTAKGRKKRTVLYGQTNIFVLSGEMVACDEHSTLMEDYAAVESVGVYCVEYVDCLRFFPGEPV